MKPSAAELARRQRLVAAIRAHRRNRIITPTTTAELVHQARIERERDNSSR